MYRVRADDWDKWEHVKSHFSVASINGQCTYPQMFLSVIVTSTLSTRDFAAASMIGAAGLRGKSWPDLDMLALGWLSNADSNEGPHRQCNLTLDEQKTQVTLWSMAKSPLMFGGDVRRLDDTTYALITNHVLLEINSYSSNNHEFPFVTGSPVSSPSKQVLNTNQTGTDDDFRSWIASGRSGEVYLAFFNLSSERMLIFAKSKAVLSPLLASDKRLHNGCRGREVWTGQDIGVIGESISKEVEPHGTALYVITC